MRFFVLLSLGITLLGCHHASLMLQDPDESGRSEGQGVLKRFRSPLPICEGSFEVSGKDLWHSRILRWLTPLPRASTPFTLRQRGAQAELLIDRKTCLDLNDPKISRLDRLYAESLRLYLLLPQWLANGQNPVLLGEQSLGTEQYTALFFTLKPGDWNDPALDQYVAYFQSQTHKLTLIQFTYRDLMKTYVGWLRFGPDKNFGGFTYPASISILDNWDATRSTHELHLAEVKCLTSN